MNVLMLLNHAPDYREPFLRELGSQVDLTVVAQSCEADGLTPPETRSGYRYIEIEPYRFWVLLWQPGLGRLLRNEYWDIVCVNANLRLISRIFLFLLHPRYQKKWIWWGHIVGSKTSWIIKMLRKWLIKKSAGCLVHSKSVVLELKEKYGVDAISFNNSEAMAHEFRDAVYDRLHQEIRMLFVGRYHPRKRLERLVQLASRREDVSFRIVGPGMENLSLDDSLQNTGILKIFGRTVGEQLKSHFDWADIVANPGHVGLLVINAARNGKGIVVDKASYHAPEHWLAIEAGQPFISFGNKEEVDSFLDRIHAEPSLIKQWGKSLQEKAKKEYTIEVMAETHLRVFQSIAAGADTNP